MAPPDRGVNKGYYAWLGTLWCIVCHHPCEQRHHIMRLHDGLPRGQYRTADKWALPFCSRHHDEMHAAGKGAESDESYVLATYGIQMIDLALTLYSLRDKDNRDDLAMRAIYRATASRATERERIK